jgi:hypothetical protein
VRGSKGEKGNCKSFKDGVCFCREFSGVWEEGKFGIEKKRMEESFQNVVLKFERKLERIENWKGEKHTKNDWTLRED